MNLIDIMDMDSAETTFGLPFSMPCSIPLNLLVVSLVDLAKDWVKDLLWTQECSPPLVLLYESCIVVVVLGDAVVNIFQHLFTQQHLSGGARSPHHSPRFVRPLHCGRRGGHWWSQLYEHLFCILWPSCSCSRPATIHTLHILDLDFWWNSTLFWWKNHFCGL